MPGNVGRGIRSLVEPGLPQLARRCLDFLEGEGIVRLWRELGRFEPEEFLEAARARLAYQVSSGNRERMLRVLLDFACEAGWLVREHRTLVSSGLPMDPGPPVGRTSGELAFFSACLDAAPAYLRGETAGIAFDARAEKLWDGFLASPLYCFARRWLLQKAAHAEAPALRCLDVAYGTGQSTLALCRQFPAAFKAGVDTHGRYQAGAARRTSLALTAGGAGETRPVAWVPPSLWRSGFEGDLPFGDGVFDLVFLSCGDPYVRPERRPGFYREVRRILGPGGRFALLTWAYPEGPVPGEGPVRQRALLHDFAESVCCGWHGFEPLSRLEANLAGAGFVPAAVLEGSFWGLEGAAWLAERS